MLGVALAVGLAGRAAPQLADFRTLCLCEFVLALITAAACLPVDTQPRRVTAPSP